MPNDKITAMPDVLDHNELEVLNDSMRMGTAHPTGRMKQAALRLVKKGLMVELPGNRFKTNDDGIQLFKNIKGKRK